MQFQIIRDRLEFDRQLIAFLEPSITPSVLSELEHRLNEAFTEHELERKYQDGRYDAYEEMDAEIDDVHDSLKNSRTEIQNLRQDINDMREQALEFQKQSSIEFERGYEAGYQQCLRDRC